MKLKVTPQTTPLKGVIEVGSDKSLTHRAYIIGALTGGKINIYNPSWGQDCLSTRSVLEKLGVKFETISKKHVIMDSSGGFIKPHGPLDCGNSGTTMRLMSGVLASYDFESELIGDQSLSKRPMKRVIEPLEQMGVDIKSNENRAPLYIYGKNLKGIKYVSKLASAQVKSAVLLAGLRALGKTEFVEPSLSRDHTERMLQYFEAKIEGTTIQPSLLVPKDLEIFSDISSAAFLIAMALLIEGSDITIKNVGLNPTRTGFLDVIKRMGANIEILNQRIASNEPGGDIRVKYSNLLATTIEGAEIPRLIDEIPILAVLALKAKGKTIIKDANDLRNKESDRIKCVVDELKKLNANIKELPDGMEIEYSELNANEEVKTYDDHRLAMSFYVAGMVCSSPLTIDGFEWANISFPEFTQTVDSLKVSE